MAIETQCEQCRKRYRVKDERAGTRIKCKECGATIHVEDPYAEDEWGDAYEAGDDLYGGGGDVQPPPRKKKKKKSSSRSAPASSGKPAWKMPVGILGMLGCLGLAVLGVVGIMDGRPKAARAIVGALFGMAFCFKMAFLSEE